MFLSMSEATIYFILVISTFYQANGQNIRIIRGEKDLITHLAGCQPADAVCFDENGTYCQCEREKTFIPTRGKCGECVPNEYLAYVTCKRHAVGCENFQDNSSLLILNERSKCKESKYWGEKEINVGTRNFTECSLLPNQAQYLHKDGWKPLSMEPNSLVVVTNESKVLLKWNLTKTPKSWKGLIVKVQYQCKSDEDDQENRDVHCVLIKYRGLFTGFNKSGGNNKRDEKDKSDPTVVVVVSVVVVAFVIGLLILFAYKYKNRLATLIGRTEKHDVTNVSPGQTHGVSNNAIYRSSDRRSAQKDCELYEATPKSEPVYQYAYASAGHEIEGQLPSNVTYDYAIPDDHLRICQRAGVGKHRDSTGENIVSQNASGPEAPVYFVLESNN